MGWRWGQGSRRPSRVPAGLYGKGFRGNLAPHVDGPTAEGALAEHHGSGGLDPRPGERQSIVDQVSPRETSRRK